MAPSTAGPPATESAAELPGYTLQDLGEMMANLNKAFQSQGKALMQAKFDQEAAARQQESLAKQQDQMNKHLKLLTTAVQSTGGTKHATFDDNESPEHHPQESEQLLTRKWRPPPSLTTETVDVVPDSLPQIRLEAPHFSGSDPTRWIRKVQKYFNHFLTPEATRLALVSNLIEPPASEWHDYFEENNPSATWEEFLIAIRLQFDPNIFEDYLGQLSKLKQTTTVLSYQLSFPALLNKVSNQSDETLISLFVSGLKQPIQKELTIRRPASLQEAFALARQHALTLPEPQPSPRAWTSRDNRNGPAQQTGQNNSTPGRLDHQPTRTNGTTNTANLPVVRVSPTERAERTRRGVCWYCEEPWTRTHVCNKRFLALMGDDDEPDTEAENEDTLDEAETMLITGDISTIHALASSVKPRSFRIIGAINQTPVSVLIDGGSTHNFINPTVAEKLSLHLQPISHFRVFVGNGDSLCCSYVCPQTLIVLQGHKFDIDLFILKVKGPDVVLGVQWLQDLGDVTNNYQKLTMTFDWDALPVILHGEGPSPRPISYNALFHLLARDPPYELFELVPLPGTCEASPKQPLQPMQPQIQALLEAYPSVFEIPSGLPPARQWDHHIHLAANTKPVNVRPYRYPYFQKTEIEKQVRDMLQQGVIQHSTSAFSSPVLLVRKKDGSFRFCVDYRALNAVTTPDHFPIPTADELFDELHAARIFSKLDLRSGYHQVRMHRDDIHKTAFRTHDGHYEFLVMPFGLTNAPSTFQAAMNFIFGPLLRKSVIVFFDDILVYSTSLDDHVAHLRQVLSILAANSFYIKMSKCSFGVPTIDYLGHIISGGELSADKTKIEAMTAWPTPSTVKQLRGFLGLTGYYRRFIAHYAVIAAPLTDLLKKEAFHWNPSAAASFRNLKEAMVSAPILRLPDFAKLFIIETDASDFGIGAVLLQDSHPLAFFSKKLGPRRRVASTYHKELYAIVEAVQKWRQYLLGREFIIRTDQRSLRELLAQVVQTPDQQFYIRKLMGFKFIIEYKSGASNKVADALSRRDSDNTRADENGPVGDSDPPPSMLAAFASPRPTILTDLEKENTTLPDMVQLRDAVSKGTAPPHISVWANLLYFKRRLYLSRDSALRRPLLEEFHDALTAGHPGERRTFTRLATSFFWLGMRKDVRDYVAACSVCQATKYVAQKPAGLLQPLPIPDRVWSAASMDFIVGLPPSHGFSAIMVVVDRLSKYAHFGALPAGFDAAKVAVVFVNTVVKLHGFPEKLLSDRDAIFMSNFWTELLTLSGTKLQFTTAYHPQTDGQSEVTNRGLEQYLRAFTFDQPKKWSTLLPWAELALNCSHHAGLGTSPFNALYGRDPPNVFATPSLPAKNVEVAYLIIERTEALQGLKKRLRHAQVVMTETANRHRRHVEFQVGDQVLLKLQPYRQHSVSRPLAPKLARRFYGPFQITERIGLVAYRLQLPAESRIHDVFHVSLLRPFIPPLSTTAQQSLPTDFNRNDPIDSPVRASATRSVLAEGVPQEQWLIYWSSHPTSFPSWEPAELLKRHFPNLRLEDKALVIGEGVDTPPANAQDPEPRRSRNHPQRIMQPDISNVPTEDVVNAEPKHESTKNDRPRRKIVRPTRYEDFRS
ncbi:hypothetical protein AAHA92_33261 [Salvia divinorum]|uniref:Reverse transcriptase n=1 Tax=Salvia divinorum TaxID=28513 RepID=A0ABD1FNE4_SALDI